MKSKLRLSAVSSFFGFLCFAAGLPASERAAIVFGNRDYPERGRFTDLRTVEQDARVMHGLLKSAGFRVGEGPVLNASREEMEDALVKFAGSLKPGDEAVVYFAGHGVQYENKVWLMGSNAEFLIKGKLGEEAVSHETVAGLLGERGVKIAVILLDCCREVPDQSWLASEIALRGLRGTERPQLNPPPNILVGFATSSERLTNDSLAANDVNGPLVDALRRYWELGLEFDSLWKAVARDVFTRSLEAAEEGKGAEIQMPSKYGQTIHDFFFTRRSGEMVGANAGFTQPENSSGMTPLIVAALSGNLDLVRQVVENGADVNQRNTLGETALMYARDAKVVRFLLDKKADPNVVAPGYSTALGWAAEQGNAEAVTLLLEHGARVNQDI